METSCDSLGTLGMYAPCLNLSYVLRFSEKAHDVVIVGVNVAHRGRWAAIVDRKSPSTERDTSSPVTVPALRAAATIWH